MTAAEEILKAKVINFLVENNAYFSFMEEIPNDWSDNLEFDDLIEDALTYGREKEFFDVTIKWDETTDGSDFWEPLYRKFRDTYDSISCEICETIERPKDEWTNMWEE